MKKSVLNFGLKVGLALFAFNMLIWYFIGAKFPFEYAELLGWTLIIVANSFVFIGVRRFRDNENGGQLSFGQAMKIGSLIALFPSVGTFIFEVILWTFSGKEFMEYYKTGMAKKMSPEAYAKMVAEMDANPMFMNPFFQGAVMFATVFLTGLAVAVVAGIFLKKR